MEPAEFELVLEATRRLVRERVVPREMKIEETDEIPGDLRAQARDLLRAYDRMEATA